MTNLPTLYQRLLSIEPVSRGFGFAVLEGPSQLVDYGVVQLKIYTHEHCLARAERVIARCEPSLMLFHHPNHPTRRSARATALLAGIEVIAIKKEIRRKRLPLARRSSAKTTKHQMAREVAEHFPELCPRLPPKRKPWTSEDVRMGMFAACASALRYFSKGTGLNS
jgi:hypothetical protein